MSADIKSAKKPRLVICYSATADVKKLATFDLIVVDNAFKNLSSLQKSIKGKNKTVFGYLSLGAVKKNEPWYECLHKKGAIGVKNGKHPSSVVLLDKLDDFSIFIDAIKSPRFKDFDGLFLDDLDLCYVNGYKNQAKELITHIHEELPELKLMANRGLEFLHDFADQIHYSLLESCFVTRRGKDETGDGIRWALQLVDQAKSKNKKLIICAVDYFEEHNGSLRKWIQTQHEKYKLISYVATWDLQTVASD